MDALKTAIRNNDLKSMEDLLDSPDLIDQLNEGWFSLIIPPLAAAQSREMVDLMLDKGADLGKLSEWWGRGFRLRSVDADVARYLVQCGATLTPHAAAGLGLTDELRALLDADPSLANSKGGDDARPLHFARNVEVAQLLIDYGAELDLRDSDHRSTPAQWLVGDYPEVARMLIELGAALDVFVAVGLEDLELVKQAVAADPNCPGYRIGNNLGPFPGIGFQGTGGTILQWSLGFNSSPQEIAMERGQQEIYDYLLERTAPRPKLMVACMVGDEPLARSIVTENPGILDAFDEDDQSLLARACWETNSNTEAVRIMLQVGFPVHAPEGNHGHSPLHNAAWDGNAPLVKLLIDHGHPIDEPDPAHNSTPLGWCIYAATEARCDPSDYAGVVDHLLASGASFDRNGYPVGHAAIDAVLRDRLGL